MNVNFILYRKDEIRTLWEKSRWLVTRVDKKILRILLPSQNRFRQEFENGVRLWGKGSRTLG
jgi:hypothetical protein